MSLDPSTPPEAPGIFRRKASWFLALTIPVAILGTGILLAFTIFSWCGISGCSGGGFGRIPDPSLAGAVLFSGIAGLLWFSALAAVPWLTPRWLRFTISAVVGIVAAVLVLLTGTDGFIR